MLLRSAVKPVNVRSTIEWVCKSPLVADGGRPMRLAIIGLSPNAERPSYEVASGMQSFGYAIVPVNPVAAGKTILGVPCVASLEEVEGPVDVCVVFRASESCPGVAREVVAAAPRLGTRALWLQLGVVSDEAMATADAAGLLTVQDKCIYVEASKMQCE